MPQFLLKRAIAVVEQFINHHRERINIRAVIRAGSLIDFWRYVCLGAAHRIARAHFSPSRFAKIAQFKVIRIGRIKNVARLYVPMDDAILFAHAQGGRQFFPDIKNLFQIGIRTRHQVAFAQIVLQQRQPFHANEHVPALFIGILALYNLAALEIGNVAFAFELLHDFDLMIRLCQPTVELFLQIGIVGILAICRVDRKKFERIIIAFPPASGVSFFAINFINAAKAAAAKVRLLQSRAI